MSVLHKILLWSRVTFRGRRSPLGDANLRDLAPERSGTPVFRVFVSCVSSEFGNYRNQLRIALTSAGREVKVQEDFADSGRTLLEKLDEYIGGCQAMIHLVGNSCGSHPRPAEVRALLRRYPDFAVELPEVAGDIEPAVCPFTYTQWEAFLAIFHRVNCFVYLAGPKSKRDVGWIESADELTSQEAHIQRLTALGQDRRILDFDDARDVAIRFLSSLTSPSTSGIESTRRGIRVPITWPRPLDRFEYALADRGAEFDFFVRFVTNQTEKRIYLVHGPSDRGKSVLVQQFAELGRKLKLHCAHAEFKAALPLADVLTLLVRDLEPLRFPRYERERARGAPSLRQAFLEDIDDARVPLLLVLDTYEQATDDARRWIEDQLLPACRHLDGLRLVLAGKVVPLVEGRPWSDLATTHELQPIHDPAHWCDYGRRFLGISRPDSDIQVLVEVAQGSPRAIGDLLRNLKPTSS